jgi:hypothetical protein
MVLACYLPLLCVSKVQKGGKGSNLMPPFTPACSLAETGSKPLVSPYDAIIFLSFRSTAHFRTLNIPLNVEPFYLVSHETVVIK